MILTFDLPDEAATVAFGQRLARALQPAGGVILLQGELGAGKTTLVRALLRTFGIEGRVVSPSYTLVEPYNAGPCQVFHMDLYRLGDPGELEYLGIRDFDSRQNLLLVEWPEHGQGRLPPEDLRLKFVDAGPGRRLECLSSSERGRAWLQRLAADEESVG